MLLKGERRDRVFYAVLIGYALTTVLALFTVERASRIWQHYLSGFIFIAIGFLFSSDRFHMDRQKWILMAMPIWYLIAHIANGQLYFFNDNITTGPYLQFIKLCSMYWLFLWMFSICEADVRKNILVVVFYILLIGCVLIGIVAIIGCFRPNGIRLPVLGTEFYVAEKYSNITGSIGPNLLGYVSVISVTLVLFLMSMYQRRRMYIAGSAVLLLLYVVIGLTNSRNCMVASALIAFLYILLWAFRSIRGSKVKRVSISMALSILCAVLVLIGFGGVCDARNAIVSAPMATSHIIGTTAKAAELESPNTQTVPDQEDVKNIQIRRRSLFEGLERNRLFTGREAVYQKSIQHLFTHPKAFVFGVIEEEARGIIGFPTTHNAWLQAFFTAGFPGFLIAIYVTLLSWKAIWKALRLSAPRTHQILAIGLLALQSMAMMESILFVDLGEQGTPFTNLVYFLSLAYLLVAQKEEAEAQAVGN